MMDSMKNYLLSVICGSIACAIVSSIMDQKGTTGAIVKLISGIFLIFTIVSPIASLKIEEFCILASSLQEDASQAAAVGQSISDASMDAIIKSELEAYLLDKANVIGAEIAVEVTLCADNTPQSVKLYGAPSPYHKYRLEAIMEEEMGIAKENQQWIE